MHRKLSNMIAAIIITAINYYISLLRLSLMNIASLRLFPLLAFLMSYTSSFAALECFRAPSVTQLPPDDSIIILSMPGTIYGLPTTDWTRDEPLIPRQQLGVGLGAPQAQELQPSVLYDG